MFSREKYNEVGGFREDIDFVLSSIDFNLKLLNKNYQNILLSHLYVNQKDYRRTQRFQLNDEEKSLLLNDWNLDNDKCYNKNLSDSYSFMLGVKNDEE